jgi:regulatory protein
VSPSAYLAALKMLARRELSEAQVRQRLARRGFSPDAIDEAVARLKNERAIDDSRVAEAIARSETGIKRRGRLRVQQQIESAGIAAPLARRAVDEIFGTIDDNELIEQALLKRMRGRSQIADEAELARLYRYLLGQGFDADQVMRTLTRRLRSGPERG